MNPDEFLDTARRLAAGSTEGDWRSPISRAYYSLLLYFREWLTTQGVPLGRSEQIHTNVCEGLFSCGVPEVMRIGQDLDHLRTKRKRADYDLHITVTQADALNAVQQVDALLADFAALTIPAATIADGVRDFLVRTRRIPPPTP